MTEWPHARVQHAAVVEQPLRAGQSAERVLRVVCVPTGSGSSACWQPGQAGARQRVVCAETQATAVCEPVADLATSG
jgi:hypothetical protein